MPVTRMRMRPWLEMIINSKKVEGLRWLDDERTMFAIPWKHAARHGWEIGKDASLFKEWAIHTGKYEEGQPGDPKTWKANFRCALNSLPDIEEVKTQSVNKGHGALRVFRLLPLSPRLKGERRSRGTKPRRQTRVKYDYDTSDSDNVPSPPQAQLPTLQDSPDSTVDSTMDSSVKSELSDHSYTCNTELPIWSMPGFEYPRTFEVSPSHSPSCCPDDEEIIKICSEWEKERQSVLTSSGFSWSTDDASFCTASAGRNTLQSLPGSPYSSSSSGDDLEELQYTDLACSVSLTTSDDMNGLPSTSSSFCSFSNALSLY